MLRCWPDRKCDRRATAGVPTDTTMSDTPSTTVDSELIVRKSAMWSARACRTELTTGPVTMTLLLSVALSLAPSVSESMTVSLLPTRTVPEGTPGSSLWMLVTNCRSHLFECVILITYGSHL